MSDKVTKKVQNCKLTNQDGNAFNLMAVWQRAARKEGWTPEEIKVVLDEAMSGDYNHLLRTLFSHIEGGGG